VACHVKETVVMKKERSEGSCFLPLLTLFLPDVSEVRGKKINPSPGSHRPEPVEIHTILLGGN